MTSMDFCKWVNQSLLPNSTLEPGYPRKVSVETAHKWLHQLGFEVLSAKKGIFIDGHEREDVAAYRKEFLHQMMEIGFLHFTEESALNFPDDIDPPTEERRSKTVFFFTMKRPLMPMRTNPCNWVLKERK